MAEGPVVLAILDRVSKDADGRLAVPVGLADGEASSLCISEAAARLLILELAGAMASVPAPGIPAVTEAMKRAGADILASAVEMPADDLVTLIYEAMALELDVVGVGDRL